MHYGKTFLLLIKNALMMASNHAYHFMLIENKSHNLIKFNNKKQTKQLKNKVRNLLLNLRPIHLNIPHQGSFVTNHDNVSDSVRFR